MSEKQLYDDLTPLQKESFYKSIKALADGGDDCIPILEKRIKDTQAPFRITSVEKTDDIGHKKTVYVLESALSIGQQYLAQFITIDQETLEMKEDAEKAMDFSNEVLIFGETGTGKEIIAKSQIGRRKGEIKAVNCAGLPRELMESELFGYVSGAYTGANKTTDGLITAAANGLLFMDEVSELPFDMQAKLLRVIQEKKVRKIGGKVDEDISCKFVFATNRNLFEMAELKLFRIDLLARISTLPLYIKPLRKRECDIKEICLAQKGGDKFWIKYGDDIMNGILELPFNVRSLQQYIIQFNVWGRVIKMKL